MSGDDDTPITSVTRRMPSEADVTQRMAADESVTRRLDLALPPPDEKRPLDLSTFAGTLQYASQDFIQGQGVKHVRQAGTALRHLIRRQVL